MRKNKDDILIGGDKWIEFISLEGRYNQALSIDHYLDGLWPLIQKLETQCVAACCGFDAFDFTEEAIREAVCDMDCNQLLVVLAEAKNNIELIDSEVLVSTRMNNLADKKVMVQLLHHIEHCILPNFIK